MLLYGEQSAARKRKRGMETSGRILSCAAEVFARKGYERATLGEIASAAGIRESSVYNHFSGKAAILQRLIEVFREEAPWSRAPEAHLEQMLDALTPQEVMKGVLLYFGTHTPRMLEHISLILESEMVHDPDAARAYRDCIVREPCEYYERLFRKMTQRGMIAPTDARLLAEQYNSITTLALLRDYCMAEPGVKERAEAVRRLVKSIDFFFERLALRR